MSDTIDNLEFDSEPEPSGRQGSRMAGSRKKKPTRPEGPGVLAAAVKDVVRLREIVAVLTRHGFSQVIRTAGLDKILGQRLSEADDGDPVDPSDRQGMARRLRQVLEDLGTTFIKLGQILSTRRAAAGLHRRVHTPPGQRPRDAVRGRAGAGGVRPRRPP